jgi:hypothetical protein
MSGTLAGEREGKNMEAKRWRRDYVFASIFLPARNLISRRIIPLQPKSGSVNPARMERTGSLPSAVSRR